MEPKRKMTSRWRLLLGVLAILSLPTAYAAQINGELKSALLEKLSSNPTGSSGRVYYNTGTGEAKVYGLASWTSLVDLLTAQTLTNKTFDSTSTMTGARIGSFTPDGTHTLTAPSVSDTLVGRATTDTLTNKALTAPTITGGAATALTGLAIRDTSAAFDVTLAATSGTTLTAGRALTIDMANAARTVKMAPLSNFSTLTDGSSGNLLSTLGSGSGYAWVAALSSTLNAGNVFIGNASNVVSQVDTAAATTGGRIAARQGTFTATVTIAAPGVWTATAHGLLAGDAIFLTTSGALPTGLAVNTIYYLVTVAANTFQLSATAGGSAITTTGTQSGTHTVNYSGMAPKPLSIGNQDIAAAAAISGSKVQTVTASNAGVLSTSSDTIAGSKTWNDAPTFKYNSGTSTAGSYSNSTGAWTFGVAAGTVTHDAFGTFRITKSDASTDITAPNNYLTVLRNNDTTTNNYEGIYFLESNSNPIASINGINQAHNAAGASTQGKLVFSTKPTGATTGNFPVARLEIASDGSHKVMLGTSAGFNVRGQANTVNIMAVSELMSSTTAGTSDSIGVLIQKGSATTTVNANHFIDFAINAGGTNSGYIGTNGASNANFFSASDRRLKKNIAPMTGALGKILELRPVTYNWKADGSPGHGFIAQELGAVLPDQAGPQTTGDDGKGDELPKGVKPWVMTEGGFVPYLVQAIKEQQIQIEDLKTQVAKLKVGTAATLH